MALRMLLVMGAEITWACSVQKTIQTCSFQALHFLWWDIQTFSCLHDGESKLSKARSSEEGGIDFLIHL